MKMILQLFGGIRGTVFAGLALILLIAFAWGRDELSNEREASATCQVDRANFAATQQNNLDVIADLTHRSAVLAEARKVEKAATGKALRAMDKEAAQADARNAELTGQLARLYAKDGGARAWAETGVDAGVAARLPR